MKHVVVNIFHTNKRKPDNLRWEVKLVMSRWGKLKPHLVQANLSHSDMFNEMSINYVNLPNNECFMIHSITNGLKSTFPLPKLTKIRLEAWRFAFFSSFSSSRAFRFRRQTANEMEPAWLTMLRHQAAENSLTTSVQRKKHFSPRVIIVVAGFKNNSKERHIL